MTFSEIKFNTVHFIHAVNQCFIFLLKHFVVNFTTVSIKVIIGKATRVYITI